MFGGPEIALLLLLIVATATDLLWGKIYNWLTLPFLVLGIAFQFTQFGSTAGWESLVSVVIALALFFPLYLVQAVAAGDAKLLMAMAAWSNPATVFEVSAVALVVGAFVGLLTLLQQKGFKQGAQSIAENLRSSAPTKTALKMPFGPAFLCAYLIVNIAQMRHWEWL